MFGQGIARTLLSLALLQFSLSSVLLAQTDTGSTSDPPTEAKPAEASKKNPSLGSAHTMLRTFFDASKAQRWGDVAKCLDFAEMPKDLSQSAKEDLAFKLKEVIDRLAYVDMSEVPRDPKSPPYRFPPGDENAPIEIAPDKHGNWVFTAQTVTEIETLYDEYKDKPKVAGVNWLAKAFQEMSPELMKTVFLIPNYQWICLLVLIFLGFIVDLLTRLALRHATAAWFKFVKSEEKSKFQSNVWRPLGLLAQALTWYFGTLLIGLPPMVLTILLVAVKFFAIVAGIWTAFRLIDLLASNLAGRAAKTGTKFDDLLIPLISKTLKVFAVTAGLLMCAEAFNLPITGLIGGLGIGGAALAFASKDAVSNVFGSVTVLTDRPFEIGDWIVTEGAEGTVENVGFRSTRIRTFYNSQITLPNSRLTTAVVDNLGRRRYRRIKTMIGLQYDTKPEQMDAFCEGIRELIRRHPYTRKDYYHVYFNAFGDSALEILLYCFVECPDWSVELREKHRLYLDIVRLADSVGVSFAFPTRTLHMFNEQQTETDLPFDGTDPASAGKQFAANIAGPLRTGDQRPGLVEFGGPFEPQDSGGDAAGEGAS